MAQGFNTGIPFVLLASAARTTSTNSGNLKDTSTSCPVSDSLTFILNVTALAGNGTAPTLDVWIDTSWDGGTTWLTAYKFTRVSTSTATLRIDTRDTGLGVTEAGVQTSVITSTTGAVNSNTIIARDCRVRWEILAAYSGSATFGVFGLAMPPGTK